MRQLILALQGAFILSCGHQGGGSVVGSEHAQSTGDREPTYLPEHPDLGRVHDFSGFIDANAGINLDNPCLGRGALPSETIAQAWPILADDQQVYRWTGAVRQLWLSADGSHVEPLLHFLRREVSDPLHEKEAVAYYNQVRLARLASITSLAYIGARSAENGDTATQVVVRTWLLECADERYWDGDAVSWRPSDREALKDLKPIWSEHCIRFVPVVDLDVGTALLAARRTELSANGHWSTWAEGGWVSGGQLRDTLLKYGSVKRMLAPQLAPCRVP